MPDNADVYRDPHVVAVYGGSSGADAAEPLAVAAFGELVRRRPVLDLGVGGGRTTHVLRDVCADYHGVDYSPGMVDLARRRHPDVRFTVADARDLPFPGGSFGGVFFSFNGIDSVGHDDRALVFESVRRVLGTGGVFLYSTLNKDGGNYRARPWRELGVARPEGVRGVLPWSVQLLKVARRRSRVAAHWWRGRKAEVDHGSWALGTLATHDFRLLNHFVTPARAFKEPTEHGFEVLKAWDTDGAELQEGATTGSAYVYLLVRKVA